jgi:hypothetical protein
MKKSSKIIVASLLLSCIAFTNVQAQDAISQPTTIGFKGRIFLISIQIVDDENILTDLMLDYMQNTITIKIHFLYNQRFITQQKVAEQTYNNALLMV